MKALVTLSARFSQNPQGRIYPQNPTLNYKFFTRYLDVFDEVLVLARVEKKTNPVDEAIGFSDGPGVSFLPIPCFMGIIELLQNIFSIKTKIQQAVAGTQAYFLRVPDFLGTLVWRELRRRNLPFAVEVVGDPGESLRASSGLKHTLLPLIRWLAVRTLQCQCQEAIAAAYVTRTKLQRLYPANPDTFTINYSSIDLPASLYAPSSKKYYQPGFRLIFVGTLDILYKGQVTLIEALSILIKKGLPFHLTLVGDGRCRSQLHDLVAALNLTTQVSFIGRVPAGEGVARALEKADLFILPSHTEGLPKALIEAMARGLPCIATQVGGIPELLSSADMVPPGEPAGLADKILEVALDHRRMQAMSERNLAVAQDYQYEITRAKRITFYRNVKELSK